VTDTSVKPTRKVAYGEDHQNGPGRHRGAAEGEGGVRGGDPKWEACSVSVGIDMASAAGEAFVGSRRNDSVEKQLTRVGI
jgi:hypothetical protein